MTAPVFNKLTIGILALGALLRLTLWWTNPPENSYDDHLTPILLIMQTGALPKPQDCWQCYHPPVFYVFSALAGKAIVRFGLDFAKTQQLFPCIFGILTLWIIHLILKKLNIQRPAHMLALGTAAFLPIHIYVSAMHTNDTIAGLGGAGCLYLAMRVVQNRFAVKWLLLLGIVTLLTIYTRHTSLVMLPVAFGLCLCGLRIEPLVPRRRVLAALVILVLVPLAFILFTIQKNYQENGTPMPFNRDLFGRDPAKCRPGRDRIDFFTFKPWIPAAYPILTEEWIDSYWTVTYANFWFDVNPFFISYTDPAKPYWSRYKRYLEDIAETPPPRIRLARLTAFCGTGLILLGLLPLALCATGIMPAFRRRAFMLNSEPVAPVTRLLCLVLLAFNAAGMILTNLHYPTYTSMKANYYLISIPALVVFLAMGIEAASKTRLAGKFLAGTFVCLFLIVITHTAHIALAQRRWLWAEELNRHGLELAGQNRPAEAADVYRRIIARYPGYIEVFTNLGNALADLGRPEAAAKEYRQALTLDPEYAPAHANLAIVLLQQDDYDEAIAHLRAALRIDPDNAGTRRLLEQALAARQSSAPPGSTEVENY